MNLREKEERDDRVRKWKELFAEVEPEKLKEKEREDGTETNV